jgi:hypothetical protein
VTGSGSGGVAGRSSGAVGLLDGLDLNEMFGAALGLAEPWRVTSVEFDQEAGRLDLGLDFPRGARFRCPEPGCAKAACAVHDTAENGEWMKGHPREGDVALLSYTISKGPELSNPMDPNSEPTGRTTFVIDEYYESPAGIARHWQESMNWPEMSSDIPAWMAKATVVTLHNGTVVQALW